MNLNQTEFEFRTDFNITDDATATFEDIRSLHNVQDDGLTGDGVTVVVMDSGIDTTHPVFDDGQVVRQVDVVGGGPGDEVGHGTACAGTIAKLAPDVDLISLRIFGNSGKTSGKTIFEAYRWLIENHEMYDVVNMSWGARRKIGRIDDKHNELVESGSVYPVVAAGNTGGRGGSPATADKAFSTAAVDASGDLTRFSSYNPNYDNPDVAAVGKNNKLPRASGTSMGTPINENWTKASGTSFSAPIISAFVARALEKYGSFPLARQFEQHARDIPGTPEDGAGVADYADTVSADDPVDAPKPEPPSVTGSAWNFAGHDTLYIGADWLHTGDATITKVEETENYVTLKVTQKK